MACAAPRAVAGSRRRGAVARSTLGSAFRLLTLMLQPAAVALPWSGARRTLAAAITNACGFGQPAARPTGGLGRRTLAAAIASGLEMTDACFVGNRCLL